MGSARKLDRVRGDPVLPRARPPRLSAGLLLYRLRADGPEVLLAHPGGPFWAKRDAGAWQIPKGMVEPGEEPLAAARREAAEELGLAIGGAPVPLCRIRQAGGKAVAVFALEADLDPASIRSNSFAMEWPPRSGRMQEFPEIDRACWFTLSRALEMMLESQRPILDALARHLAAP